MTDDECTDCGHRRSEHVDSYGADGAGHCDHWYSRWDPCPCDAGTYDDATIHPDQGDLFGDAA